MKIKMSIRSPKCHPMPTNQRFSAARVNTACGMSVGGRGLSPLRPRYFSATSLRSRTLSGVPARNGPFCFQVGRTQSRSLTYRPAAADIAFGFSVVAIISRIVGNGSVTVAQSRHVHSHFLSLSKPLHPHHSSNSVETVLLLAMLPETYMQSGLPSLSARTATWAEPCGASSFAAMVEMRGFEPRSNDGNYCFIRA